MSKVTLGEITVIGVSILALHYLLNAYAEVKRREAKYGK
jgi:hypothetical protein